MTRKPRTLSEADSRAVDAILDAGHSTAKRIAHPTDPARIVAARNLLNLLGQLPETDPPASLVAKTMDFILRRSDAGQLNRDIQFSEDVRHRS